MATVYADAAGKILRFLRDEENEREYPDPPVETAYTFRFHEKTNASVVFDLLFNFPLYSAPGGELRKNGVPVELNAGSLEHQDRINLAAAVAKLIDPSATLTQADIKLLFRVGLRRLNDQ